MNYNNRRVLLAAFIAPLPAGLGLGLSTADSLNEVLNAFVLALSIVPISYPSALVGVLVLGLPTFLALKRLNILNFFTISFVGLPLGYFSAVITGDLSDPVWLKTACISGFIVSTTAALVMLRKPNE